MIATGQVGRRNARRLNGLTRHGERHRLGPAHLFEQKPRAVGQARAQRDARLAIPRAQQRFAEPLTLPLGDDQGIARPRAFRVEPAHADADRHERTGGDDGRAFAHDRKRRLAAVDRRVAARPVPPQANCVGRLRPERAPIELLDAPAIVGAIAVDVCHVRGCAQAAVETGAPGITWMPPGVLTLSAGAAAVPARAAAAA